MLRLSYDEVDELMLAHATEEQLRFVNPVSLRAIHFGHPEEILGAAMVAGAALAALRGRIWTAAALVALAIGTKQWAIVALPALALIAGRRRSTGPALADGRVPLVLHLLSPAGRTVAITSDLAEADVRLIHRLNA